MRILNIKRDPIPPDAVYVGRGTPWGNPYRIGKHGGRDRVIALYRRHLWRQIQAGEITPTQLRALANHDLVCHCAPARCHSEVIRSAVKWAFTSGQAPRRP